MATLDLFLEFMVQRMEKIKGWMCIHEVLCCNDTCKLTFYLTLLIDLNFIL